MRPLWLTLALLLLVTDHALAASYFRSPGGSGAAEVVTGLQRGAVGYARLTAADNAAAIGTSACETVKIQLKCNIADDADFDCSAVVKQCPAGVTDGTNDQCSAILSPLTGAATLDAIYGIQAQNVVVQDATIGASQTAQLEVSCY